MTGKRQERRACPYYGSTPRRTRFLGQEKCKGKQHHGCFRFVNPTQFNDPKDLSSYPRDLEADCKLLESVGADYVFAPSVEEMYPTPDTRHFEFPPISTVMEGAHRPGHFNGVCQVVSRLFYIVRPDRAYFGEKDWQQIAVVKAMVKSLGLNVNIVECPIIRDTDGLARSSRNTLLSAEERMIAPNIFKALKESVEYAKNIRCRKRMTTL